MESFDNWAAQKETERKAWELQLLESLVAWERKMESRIKMTNLLLGICIIATIVSAFSQTGGN